jgi:hypothetical protein
LAVRRLRCAFRALQAVSVSLAFTFPSPASTQSNLTCPSPPAADLSILMSSALPSFLVRADSFHAALL